MCRRLWTSLAFVVLAIAVCAPCGTNALRVKTSFATTYLFFSFERFGFLVNGTIDMTIDYPASASGIHFFLCSQSQAVALMRAYPTASSRCKKLENIECTIVDALSNGTYHLRTTIHEEDEYHFMLSNCEGDQTKFFLDYTLLNPGGEELGSGYIPLPTLYKVFSAIWVVVTAVWLFNWLMYRNVRIGLHHVITAIPVSKLLLTSYNAYYWTQWHQSGNVSAFQQIVYYALMLVFEAVFFSTLLLVSKGWCITRTNIVHMEKRAIVVTVVSLVFSMLFYKLLGGYYLFALIVIVVIVLKFIFSSISQNMRVLRDQLTTVAERATVVPSTTPVYAKFLLFKRFQSLMFTYVFCDTASIIVVIFFLTYVQWIESLLQEVLELCTFVAIAVLFRLRSFSDKPQPLVGNVDAPVIRDVADEKRAEIDVHSVQKVSAPIYSQLGIEIGPGTGHPVVLTVCYPRSGAEEGNGEEESPRSGDGGGGQIAFATLQNPAFYRKSE